MTVFGYVVLTAGIAALIAMLVTEKVSDYRTRSCPPAVEFQITCATAEPAPFLSREEGPEQYQEFVHLASPNIEAAITPTAGALPFIDSPMPPARMLSTINRAAVSAMMNQGSELPAGFHFASPGFPDGPRPVLSSGGHGQGNAGDVLSFFPSGGPPPVP